MLHRLFYGIISFFCFTWLLVSWGVVSNGRIELIKMNEETVEASYDTGGTDAQHQEKQKIALTFDDGPHPSGTPVLLDGLAERNVKVTFFVIGENAVKYPKLLTREAEEGHIIGNHTYSHVDLTKMSQETAECNWKRLMPRSKQSPEKRRNICGRPMEPGRRRWKRIPV